MFPSLIDRVIAIALAGLVVVLLPTAGWNWWRKNVYYDALQQVATEKAAKVAKAEKDLQAQADQLATDYRNRSFERERQHQRQIDEILERAPAERVVYRLQDRWLPRACPTESAPGADPVEAGGLDPADELFLVRFAKSRDDIIDERNRCVAMYEAARAAAVEVNQ
jgi:hypothetical protein